MALSNQTTHSTRIGSSFIAHVCHTIRSTVEFVADNVLLLYLKIRNDLIYRTLREISTQRQFEVALDLLLEYSTFNYRFEKRDKRIHRYPFQYACYYIYRRIYEDDVKYFQNPSKVGEFVRYKKARRIRSFSKSAIENGPIAMCTSQTDHRARRDVYARLCRHYGVPFRSARFHKKFGCRDVMLSLARSSAHRGDSKAMKILFDYLLQEGSNLLSLEDYMSILNEMPYVVPSRSIFQLWPSVNFGSREADFLAGWACNRALSMVKFSGHYMESLEVVSEAIHRLRLKSAIGRTGLLNQEKLLMMRSELEREVHTTYSQEARLAFDENDIGKECCEDFQLESSVDCEESIRQDIFVQSHQSISPLTCLDPTSSCRNDQAYVIDEGDMLDAPTFPVGESKSIQQVTGSDEQNDFDVPKRLSTARCETLSLIPKVRRDRETRIFDEYTGLSSKDQIIAQNDRQIPVLQVTDNQPAGLLGEDNFDGPQCQTSKNKGNSANAKIISFEENMLDISIPLDEEIENESPKSKLMHRSRADLCKSFDLSFSCTTDNEEILRLRQHIRYLESRLRIKDSEHSLEMEAMTQKLREEKLKDIIKLKEKAAKEAEKKVSNIMIGFRMEVAEKMFAANEEVTKLKSQEDNYLCTISKLELEAKSTRQKLSKKLKLVNEEKRKLREDIVRLRQVLRSVKVRCICSSSFKKACL